MKISPPSAGGEIGENFGVYSIAKSVRVICDLPHYFTAWYYDLMLYSCSTGKLLYFLQ